MMSVSQQKRHKTELKLSCNEMFHHTITKHDDFSAFLDLLNPENKQIGRIADDLGWMEEVNFEERLAAEGENLYAVNVKSCGMAHILSARTE